MYLSTLTARPQLFRGPCRHNFVSVLILQSTSHFVNHWTGFFLPQTLFSPFIRVCGAGSFASFIPIHQTFALSPPCRFSVFARIVALWPNTFSAVSWFRGVRISTTFLGEAQQISLATLRINPATFDHKHLAGSWVLFFSSVVLMDLVAMTFLRPSLPYYICPLIVDTSTFCFTRLASLVKSQDITGHNPVKSMYGSDRQQRTSLGFFPVSILTRWTVCTKVQCNQHSNSKIRYKCKR